MNHEDTVSERPWGHYIKLYQEKNVWVKRVEVLPGQRLSLQRHKKRSEKWIVVSGGGTAVIGDSEIPLQPGAIVDVPCEAVHRLCSDPQKKLVIIEVATGEFLSEADIERLQDDYQRSADDQS